MAKHRLIKEILCGIQATKDVKLSNISRSSWFVLGEMCLTESTRFFKFIPLKLRINHGIRVKQNLAACP
jgi:hypothetical protein